MTPRSTHPYRLTLDDWTAALITVSRPRWARTRSSLVTGALILLASGLLFPADGFVRGIGQGAAITALSIGIFSSLGARGETRKLLKHPSNEPLWLERTLSLDEQGLETAASDGSSTRIPWDAVQRVTREGDLLFVWVNGLSFLLFPVTALPGDALRDFARRAKCQNSLKPSEAGSDGGRDLPSEVAE